MFCSPLEKIAGFGGERVGVISYPTPCSSSSIQTKRVLTCNKHPFNPIKILTTFPSWFSQRLSQFLEESHPLVCDRDVKGNTRCHRARQTEGTLGTSFPKSARARCVFAARQRGMWRKTRGSMFGLVHFCIYLGFWNGCVCFTEGRGRGMHTVRA